MTVSIEVDHCAPIGGWIARECQARTRFEGWLELVSWLQRAVGEAEAAAAASSTAAAHRRLP